MSDFNDTNNESISCPHCGEQILKKALICKHCKKSVEMAECPFCAELNLKDAKMCKHCDSNLEKSAEHSSSKKIDKKAPVNEKRVGLPIKRLEIGRASCRERV